MAPLTTGAPPAAAHAIHAKAHAHDKKQQAQRKAAPKKSRSPKLHPRRTTTVAKRAVRVASPYRVQPGDNLTRIAAQHHVSIAALVKANGISDPNRVLSGSVLRVPRTVAVSRHTDRVRHTAAKTKATPKSTAKSRAARRLAAQVSATRHALAKRPVPSRTQTKSIIESTSRRYGVNPRLALGIGWQESGWNQRAVSPVNAIGTMQVMPDSGRWASGLVGHQLDLLNSRDNVTAGVAILRYLTSNAKNLDEAIGAYYQGLGGIREHGPYDDTKRYVRNVRAIMERL